LHAIICSCMHAICPAYPVLLVTITILDIIHRSGFYLKHDV
jgi:hypothetical protein